MKTIITKAFNESNIEYIAQYIITHLQQPRTMIDSCSNASTDEYRANYFEGMISRFFSMPVKGYQKHTHRKVLYALLVRNLGTDTLSTESGSSVSSSRIPFVFGSSISVNIVLLLCQLANFYENPVVSRIFMELALFFLRCFHTHARIFKAGKSLKAVLQDFGVFDKKDTLHQVDYEGLCQIYDIAATNSRFMIDSKAELKNRHFEPLFALPGYMDKWEVYRLFTDFNSEQRKNGKCIIALSYTTYSDLLCLKSMSEHQMFSVFQDLKEESEMTEMNIMIKKASQNQNVAESQGITSGVEEHVHRKTWGCIFGGKLAHLLLNRFTSTFRESETTISIHGEVTCRTCNSELLPISSACLFTPMLKQKIFIALLNGTTSTQKNDFMHFHSSDLFQKKDLYIIDGLNVAYYARSRWGKSAVNESFRFAPRLHQIESIVQELQRQQVPHSSIRIVLPRRHCIPKSELGVEQFLLDKWSAKDMLVQSPDSLSDDFFWLSYAMSHFTETCLHMGRTFLLTNDLMRDHQTRILSGTCNKTLALFRQWKSVVQVFFDIHCAEDTNELSAYDHMNDKLSVRLDFPPLVIYGIQSSEDSVRWHIPFLSDGNSDSTIYGNHNQCIEHRVIKWLCGKRCETIPLVQTKS